MFLFCGSTSEEIQLFSIMDKTSPQCGILCLESSNVFILVFDTHLTERLNECDSSANIVGVGGGFRNLAFTENCC